MPAKLKLPYALVGQTVELTRDGLYDGDTRLQCFCSCSTSLVGGNGTVWASSKTGYTYFRIDAASTPEYINAA